MIELQRVSIAVGDFEITDVSFEVPTGCYAALMGRTGAGKTTILESICGLRKIRKGVIRLAGADVTRWSPSDRCVGYVPQDLALFPTMTVQEHLEFAAKLHGWKKSQIQEQVESLAEQLEIKHLLQRRPLGLSGGESQRVALGRALAFRPHCLLLDEPLSALDKETRQGLQSLLLKLNRELNVTVLHVTHDESEAEILASKIIRLS